VIGEQSSRRSGSATMVAESTISRVTFIWYCACGFLSPLAWFFTATSASCSRVVP
jgi:hypothetical protein